MRNKYRIAICGLVRDCASRLSRNLKRLHTLSNYFEIQYFIVENDSKDLTPQVLNKWQLAHPNMVHLPDFYKYVEQVKTTIVDKELQASLQTTFSNDRSLDHQNDREIFKKRIMRISLARDCYLHALLQSDFQADMVLMVDLDVYSFSVEDIINQLQSDHGNHWDVLTANGRKYECFSQAPKIRDVYYDSYAVELQEQKKMPFDWNLEYQSQLASIKKGDNWYGVRSAFGGMAIYKYAALYNKDTNNPPSYLQAIHEDEYQFCEHVSFHRALYSRGYDKIFINPSLLLRYNTKLHAIARTLLSRDK